MKVEIHETIDSPWGPLHCVASAEHPVIATVVGDPYPPDVLAACPKAREWGVVFRRGSSGQGEFTTGDGKHFWGSGGRWREQGRTDLFAYADGAKALANPPTTPPPGYVEPKDIMKEAMAMVDARAEQVVASIPLSQRAIVGANELRKAERSTVDRLGEVQYLAVASGMYGPDGPPPWESLKEHQKWLYCNAAQAVRLAELEEKLDYGDVLKAAEAAYDEYFADVEVCAFDECDENTRQVWIAIGRAAISAALASRVARARREGADR